MVWLQFEWSRQKTTASKGSPWYTVPHTRHRCDVGESVASRVPSFLQLYQCGHWPPRRGRVTACFTSAGALASWRHRVLGKRARQSRREMPYLGGLRRRVNEPGQRQQFADQHHLPRERHLELRILVRVLEPRPGVDDSQHPFRAQHPRQRGPRLGPRAAAGPERPSPHVLLKLGEDDRVLRARQHLLYCDGKLPADGERLDGRAGDGPQLLVSAGSRAHAVPEYTVRAGDFRLAGDSPARNLVGDSAPVGAGERLEK